MEIIIITLDRLYQQLISFTLTWQQFSTQSWCSLSIWLIHMQFCLLDWKQNKRNPQNLQNKIQNNITFLCFFSWFRLQTIYFFLFFFLFFRQQKSLQVFDPVTLRHISQTFRCTSDFFLNSFQLFKPVPQRRAALTRDSIFRVVNMTNTEVMQSTYSLPLVFLICYLDMHESDQDHDQLHMHSANPPF